MRTYAGWKTDCPAPIGSPPSLIARESDSSVLTDCGEILTGEAEGRLLNNLTYVRPRIGTELDRRWGVARATSTRVGQAC